MMPEIPVHTQPLPEIPGGTPDGIVRLVGHMLGTHPRVGIVTPLRDIARGERLTTPLGREGKRTVPPDNGIFPTLRRETRDRDPRQAERPVRDPSGRGGDGIAERNRRRRTLRRIGLSAAAAVFRPVIERTLGIVYHEELHGGGMRRVTGFERSDVERLLDAPAFGGDDPAVFGAFDHDIGEFQIRDQPPGGQVGLYVPLQQLAAVGKCHVHPHGIFHRRIVQRQLPREHQSFGQGVIAHLYPAVNGVLGFQLRVFPLGAFVYQDPRRFVLACSDDLFPVEHQFLDVEASAPAENGLDRTVRQGVVFAGTACGRFILCEYLRV